MGQNIDVLNTIYRMYVVGWKSTKTEASRGFQILAYLNWAQTNHWENIVSEFVFREGGGGVKGRIKEGSFNLLLNDTIQLRMVLNWIKKTLRKAENLKPSRFKMPKISLKQRRFEVT